MTGVADAAKKRRRAPEWRDGGTATVKEKRASTWPPGCVVVFALPPETEDALRDGARVRLAARKFGQAILIGDSDNRALGEFRTRIGKPCEKIAATTFKLKVGKPIDVRTSWTCPSMTVENQLSCKDRLDAGKEKAVVTYRGGTDVKCRRGQAVVHRGHEGTVWAVAFSTRRAHFDVSCHDLAKKTPEEEKADAEKTRARMAEGRKSCVDEAKRQRCLSVLKSLQTPGGYGPRRRLAPGDALQTYYLTLADATAKCGNRAERAQMRSGDCFGCEFFRCSTIPAFLTVPDWAKKPQR